MFDEILQQDPEGILLSPITETVFTESVQAADEQGIPVVTIGTDLPESRRTSYVTSDAEKEGREAAKRIGDALQGWGSVLILRDPGQPQHDQCADGFAAYFRETYPGITIYEEETGANARKARKAVRRVYNSDMNLRAVFAPEPVSAEGAVQAAVKIGSGDQIIAACCGISDKILDYMTEEKMLFAVAPDQYLQGYIGMLDLYFAAHKEFMGQTGVSETEGTGLWQNPYTDAGYSVVTKENADSFYLSRYAKSLGLSDAKDLIEPLLEPKGNGFGTGAGETYYLCVPGSGEEYWDSVIQGMKDAAFLLGMEAECMDTREHDTNAQIEVFDEILTKDPAGIILNPAAGDSFVDPIRRAAEQDVNVVTLAADSQGSARTAYVASDNAGEGKAAAKEMGEALGGKGAVLVMRNPGQTDDEKRDDAFIAYIE